MKIALYMENGFEQIILTPDNAQEQLLLKILRSGDRTVSITNTQFYHTQGGYLKQGPGADSTLLVLRPAPQEEMHP